MGAVAAVRSPGEGSGAGTAVGGDQELREAFDAAADEGGLLGLDGFRVSLVYLGLDELQVDLLLALLKKKWT